MHLPWQEVLLYVQPKCFMPSLSNPLFFCPPTQLLSISVSPMDVEGAERLKPMEEVGMRDDPQACWGMRLQEIRLQQSLPEALLAAGASFYSSSLFILCLVFAEGCGSHTYSLGPAMPWEQGPARR